MTKVLAEGVKYDQDKPGLQYLSTIWINGVGKVLSFGARKYADHNWRKGIKLSRLLRAALGHTLAFMGGEDNDPETGLSHLYHASCCLMFAAETYELKPEFDDRYKHNEKALTHSQDSKENQMAKATKKAVKKASKKVAKKAAKKVSKKK